MCDTGVGSRKESLQRECADPQTIHRLSQSYMAAELSVMVIWNCRVVADLCFHLGDERGSREREFKCGGERMASKDGQFDLRALQRVGDWELQMQQTSL